MPLPGFAGAARVDGVHIYIYIRDIFPLIVRALTVSPGPARRLYRCVLTVAVFHTSENKFSLCVCVSVVYMRLAGDSLPPHRQSHC